MTTLTPDLMLRAYASGIFPMAETGQSEELYWFDPHVRAILPLEAFHFSRKLKQTVARGEFEVRIDTDFAGVISGCATTRDNTWINAQIRDTFIKIHEMGHAHSVEAWQNGKLVGGLYGAALGGVFFGESMFSHVSNASKVCLVHLVARLRANGFTLLDVQYHNDHLAQFGITEIPRQDYRQRLAGALAIPANFRAGDKATVLLAGLGINLLPPAAKRDNP